jgi:hypothetical protein
MMDKKNCLESDRFHCRDAHHCRCPKCHAEGENSKFPDLSENPGCRDCRTHHPGEDGIVITAQELREALVQLLPDIAGIRSTSAAEGIADRIMKHAADRREPEYSPHTEVRDARGIAYKRTSGGNWLSFGTSHVFDHDYPQRPLEVISDHNGRRQ